MSNAYVLGSDIGTGSCKTVLLDTDGQVIASAGATYPTHYPQPDWAEQDPEDWYAAFCTSVRSALARSGISARSIRAVSIAGVTHNPVLLDTADRVLRPAIHFWDQRSGAQVAAIRRRWGAAVREKALNDVDVLWTWPQLLWVREHEPQVWSRIATLFFPKDYVRHRLAPSRVTDAIDPAGTLLYDPRQRAWINEFVDDLQLPPRALPPVVGPLEAVGTVSAAGAADSGLAPGTAVLAGTTDTAAEVVGAGGTVPGVAVVKLASVGRLMVVAREPLPGGRYLNYPHVLDGLWYPGSVTKYGAAAYRWAREVLWPELKGDGVYRRMDEAAAQAPAGADGLFFLPHLLGEYAPQWDPRLRAAFIGLTVRHGRPHLTRAVLEGVAFQLRAALGQLEAAGATYQSVRLIGGGAASPLWAQIVSSVLDRDLLVPRERDAAYGAALLAGIGAGFFPAEPEALARIPHMASRLSPVPPERERYRRMYAMFRAADDALA